MCRPQGLAQSGAAPAAGAALLKLPFLDVAGHERRRRDDAWPTRAVELGKRLGQVGAWEATFVEDREVSIECRWAPAEVSLPAPFPCCRNLVERHGGNYVIADNLCAANRCVEFDSTLRCEL